MNSLGQVSHNEIEPGVLKTCFTVLTTNMYFLFCGVRRLAVRRIFLLK